MGRKGPQGGEPETFPPGAGAVCWGMESGMGAENEAEELRFCFD